MGKRREARERAVQFLFQHDLNRPDDLERALGQFWESQRAAAIAEEKGTANWGQPVELPPPTTDEAAIRLFAEPLIRGALEHRDEADEIFGRFDLFLKMLVLGFDVFNRFRRGVLCSVADKNGVRGCDIFQEIIDGLVG